MNKWVLIGGAAIGAYFLWNKKKSKHPFGEGTQETFPTISHSPIATKVPVEDTSTDAPIGDTTPPRPSFVEGEFLLRFKDGVDPEIGFKQIQEQFPSFGLTHGGYPIVAGGTIMVNIGSGNALDVSDAVKKVDTVRWAHPNHLMYLDDCSKGPC